MHYKDFINYSEAYQLYAEINYGKDSDRKNPTIAYIPETWMNQGTTVARLTPTIPVYRVIWETK